MGKFSQKFKEEAVSKFLNRGTKTIYEIAKELNVSHMMLYRWKKDLLNSKESEDGVSPQDRPSKEKFSLVFEYYATPEDKRGEFCRSKGVFKENIQYWESLMEKGLSPKKEAEVFRSDINNYKKRIVDLEKTINGKDKVIAEMSDALFIKKKI